MPSNSEYFTCKTPTGLRSGDKTHGVTLDEFQAACRRENLGSIQAALLNLSKKDAVELLRSEFPHKSKSWFERNLKYLMAMDKDDFYVLFNHQDPTAKTAIRNLSRQNANHRVSPTRLAFSM